eukprot:Selendium_serpulae@DN6448_c0_g1_i19.p1
MLNHLVSTLVFGHLAILSNAYQYASVTPESLNRVPPAKGDATETQFIPLSMFVLMEMAGIKPDMQAVHLTGESGENFHGKIDWVVQGPCEVPEECLSQGCCAHTESCFARVGLSGGWLLKVTLDHLTLLEPNGNVFIDTSVVRNCAGSE